MVDREARDEALYALGRFLRCETTNDQYESEYPLAELFGRKASKDVAIRAIHSLSWNWFDDFFPHKLEGGFALGQEGRELADGCCLFLSSSCEYEWREANFIGVDFFRSANFATEFITLGLSRTNSTVTETETATEWMKRQLAQPEGNASVWPFFRQSDFIAAKQNSEANIRN